MKFYGILLIVGIFVTVQAQNAQDKSATNLKSPELSPTTAGPSVAGQNTDNKDKNSAPCPPLPGQSAEPLKGKDCTREYKPICSSSGQTYNNQCEFENAQIRDSTLTMTRIGAC